MPPPPPFHRIPSPPLAPGETPLDLAHLAHMTLGDVALKREVLGMFLGQTAELVSRLAAEPEQGAALAHTLKGSARAIGAFRVAACAEALEDTMRQRADSSAALAELKVAVADAHAAIDAILALP